MPEEPKIQCSLCGTVFLAKDEEFLVVDPDGEPWCTSCGRITTFVPYVPPLPVTPVEPSTQPT